MAVPTTRDEFKAYCLRRLGAPVIEINVDDDQVDDRVDEALEYFWDYHFDGSEKVYYAYQLTTQDFTNKYITLPDNILGAVNIFDVGTYYGMANMFNIRYQIALNDMYTLTSFQLAPYYMALEHLQFMEQILVGKVPLRYNRYNNKLHLDMDWNKVQVGQYIIVEAYQIVNPDTYSKVWGDRWLQRYCTALIKRQWGSNITKFDGMTLPGGVKFNGTKIYDDAVAEIADLEEKMMDSYSIPPEYLIG